MRGWKHERPYYLMQKRQCGHKSSYCFVCVSIWDIDNGFGYHNIDCKFVNIKTWFYTNLWVFPVGWFHKC